MQMDFNSYISDLNGRISLNLDIRLRQTAQKEGRAGNCDVLTLGRVTLTHRGEWVKVQV